VLTSGRGQIRGWVRDRNIDDGPLRQIDIHASKRFITEWLE